MDEAQVIPLRGGVAKASRRRGEQARTDSHASVHPLHSAPARRPESVLPEPARTWEQRAADAMQFLRRRITGDYDVDTYGFDADLTGNVTLPLFKTLYDHWFRVEVNGTEHIPESGGALLVANHAGGVWALDAVMTAIAVHVEHPAHRYLRMLGADLVFSTPGLGPLARKSGATLACTADAERLLSAGELVGVWPEGFKGIGKPFRERYTLQRFGRGGFVSTALRAGVPIIPVSVVGAEEIHPVLSNAKTLARILNLPYFPITPTFPWLGPLGLVPLPSKWYIEFGAPISTEAFAPEQADHPAVLFDLTDQVRESIQSTLYRLLVQRRSVWR
ncbi:MAG TPA: lysophospholipid acyltransferase family protein [Jatrophihabitantaceae bacterium]|nr:lysophospholipid acyltransferase family protein [Jatrophihabitantaceae bacterium]